MSTHICPNCNHTYNPEIDDASMPAEQLAWIVRAIAAHTPGTTAAAVMNSRHRARHLLIARRRVYLVLRQGDNSYPQIGRMFGRDHTTIMSSVKNATAEDEEIATRVHFAFLAWLENPGQEPVPAGEVPA